MRRRLTFAFMGALLLVMSLLITPSTAQEFVAITAGTGHWFGLTRSGDVYRFQIPFGPGIFHGSMGPGVWVDMEAGFGGPLYIFSETGELWEMSMGTNASTNLLVPSPGPGPWMAWSNQYAVHANGDIWNLWPGSDVARVGSFVGEPPISGDVRSWGEVKGDFTQPTPAADGEQDEGEQ